MDDKPEFSCRMSGILKVLHVCINKEWYDKAIGIVEKEVQNENTDLRLEERAELFEKLGILYNLKSGGNDYEKEYKAICDCMTLKGGRREFKYYTSLIILGDEFRRKGELDSALDAYRQGLREFEEHSDLFVAPIDAVEAEKKAAEEAISRQELNGKMSSISNSIQQGNERKILVRSVNRDSGKILCGNVEESYRREDFHVVDLKLNKIYRNCLPSLPRACRHGNMVASGQSIFIFGGWNSIDDKSSLFKFAKSHPESHFHMGASRFHFDPADLKDGLVVRGRWAPAPPMNTQHGFICTCLNGDVYSVGCNFFSPEVLYVDTTNIEVLGPWKSLVSFPPELRNCRPCNPVIPDPTNNRILVHFYGGQLPLPSLYAFYPPDRQNQDDETGVWRCLNSNLLGWKQVVDAALLDGVLFLHGRKFPNLVSAYEVDTGKYLEVQWSSRDIEKDVSVDKIYFHFDSLFCLDDANKILCLAVYSPIDLRLSIKGGDPNSLSKTFLLFFKFKVKRCHSTISLTPLDTHSYEIESTTEVLNFLLL